MSRSCTGPITIPCGIGCRRPSIRARSGSRFRRLAEARSSITISTPRGRRRKVPPSSRRRQSAARRRHSSISSARITSAISTSTEIFWTSSIWYASPGPPRGESRRVEDNLFLGEFEVHGVPRGPAGQEIDLRFTYDLNGVLEVEATVVETKKQISHVITRYAHGLTPQDQ